MEHPEHPAQDIRAVAGRYGYLAGVLRKGKEQGLFRSDLDDADGATWLILLIKGTTLHCLANPGAVDFEQLRVTVEHWPMSQCWQLSEKDS